MGGILSGTHASTNTNVHSVFFRPFVEETGSDLPEGTSIDQSEPDASEVRLTVARGCIIETSQLNDYAFRGEEFQDMNFVDFCVFTNHKRIDFDVDTPPNPNNYVPNPAARSMYHPDHPQSSTHYRQVCSNPSKGLPCFIGATFASPDIESERLVYLASMQVLYRPWRTWDDVMSWAIDWETSFASFYNNCPPFIQSCIENTQLSRQAREAADADHIEEESVVEDENLAEADKNLMGIGNNDNNLDEIVNDFETRHFPPPYMEKSSVMTWAEDCVRLGVKAGLFPNAIQAANTTQKSKLNGGATTNASKLREWSQKMDEHTESIVKGDTEKGKPTESYVILGFDPACQAVVHQTEERSSFQEI